LNYFRRFSRWTYNNPLIRYKEARDSLKATEPKDIIYSIELISECDMDINIDEHPDALVVSVAGRIDASNSPEIEKEIATCTATVQTVVVLDLQGMEYMSSAGLRVVLISAKNLKAKGQDLFISGLQGSVKDVFELSGFYSIFRIFQTVEEALNSIGV
jgi:anti-anti-sigma factor